ncbi:1-aminocyclopropane-1-carboxylate deaminase/D-cysteine desulfhydrase [Thiomicrospira microaerophila]|uniref:1-aminocyclopropane-1-carboxylate deaminase/D-cysteine desulfhydrase n=1 Tax=Thiomicrospira microaerophila TaxID=406020 RepID=UPI00200DDDB3|nr:pyridoxal-phosphate dependent enzyme [Thiomicrospira microaerophila]
MSATLRLIQAITPLQKCNADFLTEHRVELWVKRDELNHPLIQGNKWHKLKLNLAAAQQQGFKQLLTFGGAYSNHIAAVAAAAQAYAFTSLGFIRGEELASHYQAWSATLKTAAKRGMQFEFVDRATYRLRQDLAWLASLAERFPEAYILPEGGSNALAIEGFESVIAELKTQVDFTHLLCAVGTGGTLAGLARYAKPDQKVWGIASLKNAEYLIPQITNWVGKDQDNWRLLTDFNGGGYGKTNNEIQQFARDFEKRFDLKLDPIYTAKLVYGFHQLLISGAFEPGSRIVIYHSGGLQGRAD